MERNSLFQFTVNNALEIIIVFNEQGEICYGNNIANKQLEYGMELQGTLITEVFPGEFRIEDGSVVADVEFGEELQKIVAYRKNRTCFPVGARFYRYMNEDGKTEYICTAYNSSTEDYLEKKVSQADQEAEEALKVKNEFVANVTHELRTPVNGILGNTLELIKMEEHKDKLDLLYLVERSCKDMNCIINNILDFSKLEAGKFVLEPRSFNLRNMIDYVKKNHSNRIIEKGLEFSITVSPDIPENVVGDELRIVQILNNLISNAFKFTSVGEIHVDVVKTGQTGDRIQLFFMVSDTGIGIDKNQHDKLFKSFSQVDASISRRYGGTGLGLNICKQLVELMNGSIHVDSQPGMGSTFSFDVWLGLDKIEGTEMFSDEPVKTSGQILIEKLQKLSESQSVSEIWQYGSVANSEELEKKMSKLILSIEMENWEKAETFADTVKKLVEEGPREVKSAALKLKMAVQKADYDKAVAAFDLLREGIQSKI